MGFRCKNATNANVMDCPGAEKFLRQLRTDDSKFRYIRNYTGSFSIWRKSKVDTESLQKHQDVDQQNIEDENPEKESIFGMLGMTKSYEQTW